MKKTLALLLALCMALSVCPALADETQALKDARSYINLMYKNKPASTPKDYQLIGSVPSDGEPYTVEYSFTNYFGRDFWLRAVLNASRSHDGSIAIYANIYDLTVQHELEMKAGKAGRTQNGPAADGTLIWR